MSTNISKKKRDDLLDKIKQIRAFIAAAPQDENTGNLLSYLSDLEKDVNGKKYGLVFEEHREEIDEVLDTHTPVLTEDKDLFIDNGGQMNFLIEGDNLASLKLLEKTHKGKIDLIYIDPPYNTGNKDFIYDDSFIDKNDLFSHSKWLSFIKHRLLIARNLLTKRGAIFISIDDNEQSPLKVLCDEIFGAENFVTCLVWAAGRKNDSKYISVSHEYMLCYVKSMEYLKTNKIVWKQRKQGIDDIYKEYEQLKKKYGSDYREMSSALKQWYKNLPENHPARNHSHYNFIDETGIYFPSDISWPGGGGPKYEVLHPITHKPVRVPNRGWVYPTKERMQEIISQKLVHFGDDETSVPCKKTYLKDNEMSTPYSVFYKDGRAATKRLRTIMGENVFQNPKDEEILESIIEFAALYNSTILDFFAGSGTTGHAVMKLNAEDGGNRKFILCTNNENGICRDVTYERIRRVIDKEDYAASLKYYKVDYQKKNILSSKSRLDITDDKMDEKYEEYKEAIKTGEFSDEYNLTNKDLEKLKSDSVTTVVPTLLDMMFTGADFVLPNAVAKEVYEDFQCLYKQYLGRELTAAEKYVFDSAIKIMIWKVHGKTFSKICQERYAYVSNVAQRRFLAKAGQQNRADNLPVRYIAGYSDIPDKELRAYPLFPVGTKGKDVDYDRIVYDTYDFLDKLIGFKLSDLFYAIFHQYYLAYQDNRAERLAKYIKYGTEDSTEIWMLRYGFSFEEIEWLKPCVESIDQTEIRFNGEIESLDDFQRSSIAQYLF